MCGTSKWFPPNNDDGKPKLIAPVGAAELLKFCFESDIWIVFAVGSIFDAVIKNKINFKNGQNKDFSINWILEACLHSVLCENDLVHLAIIH